MSQRARSDTALRLATVHAAAFAGIGIQMPFLPVWMESRSLSPAAIGVLLAIPTLVRVLVTAPVMTLADRPAGARRLLVLGQFGAAMGFSVMLGAESAVAIGVLVALIAVAQAPIVPTGDLLTTDAVRADPALNYGRIRVWGSVAFLVTSIIGGYVLALLPPDGILWALVAIALVSMAVSSAAATRRESSPEDEATPEPVRRRRPALPRALLVVIAACALVQASHAAVYAFGSIHWRSLGFPGPVIGTLWAVGVVAEILLFVWLGRMVSGGARGLVLVAIGAGAGMLRFGLLALDPGLAVTFGLQAMHGLTFGATHLGAMAALTALSPPGARGAAQGIYGACLALAVAFATMASGWIYRAAGPLAFAAMVPLAGLGLALTLVALRQAAAAERAR